MSRYAMLTDAPDGAPPRLRHPAPAGFHEVWVSEYVVRDQPVRRAVVRRAIAEATDELLVSKRYGEVIRMVAGLDTIPQTSRPRLRWRRATPMQGEPPMYVLTVVVYPKGALP